MKTTPASLPTVQLTVIGCGTLGCAIVDGLLNMPNRTRNYRLGLTARRQDHAIRLKENYPDALVCTDTCSAGLWTPVKDVTTHLVVIGTQPQFTKTVCVEIRDAVERFCRGKRPVILTVCPGIQISQLQTWLPIGSPIVRSMPNTPIAVGQGATAIFANEFVGAEEMAEVKLALSSVSPCVEFLDREDLLDVVASVSGPIHGVHDPFGRKGEIYISVPSRSAPAYVFYLARAMVEAGIAKGLPAEQAKSLVTQSVIGSGVLAQATPRSLPQLLSDVCVPGGSTEKAMFTLDSLEAARAILEAVHVSWKANTQMGKV